MLVPGGSCKPYKGFGTLSKCNGVPLWLLNKEERQMQKDEHGGTSRALQYNSPLPTLKK